MGCINSKVAPLLPTARVRSKKEQKLLKKMLKSEGIQAKVTKSGVSYEIVVAKAQRIPILPAFTQSSKLHSEKKRSVSEWTEVAAKQGRAFLELEKVREVQRQKENAEMLWKAALKERIESKQEKAKMRREEREKVAREVRRRQAIKHQTITKMNFMFELLDILS